MLLDVPDETGLDDHDGCHERDHAEEEWTATDAVDEEPGDERGEEEPGVEDSRHESGEFTAEVEGVLEEGAGVVNESVDAAELLENLNAAGDEESATRLDIVVFEEVRPCAGSDGGFVGDCVGDVAVHAEHGGFAHLALVDSAEDVEAFFAAVVRDQPAWGIGYQHDDEQHGNEKDALQNHGDSPCIAGSAGNFAKAVVDPVDHHDAKVET